MMNRRFFTIVLALVVVFVLVLPAQAQEDIPVSEFATRMGYLATYDIVQLRFDPLWYIITHPGQPSNATMCVCNHAYLTTYGIAGLENDPLWTSGAVEFAAADRTQGS
ncbi:MAG: hypothetical protein K8J31_04350 [Anaerolineae bacterium]|nr:hypothetical protein [Anaerolineae bacterium]